MEKNFSLKSNQESLREIIESLKYSNVEQLGLPKDIRDLLKKGSKEACSYLEQALSSMEITQKNLLNKAREILSFKEHDLVYDNLNDLSEEKRVLFEERTENYNWAQAYITVSELMNLRNNE